MTEPLSGPLDEFKARELEIISLMAEGLSNQEIADTLFITKETVRWYNKQIYSKLGTSRRIEAIALAREWGLIDEPDSVTPKPLLNRLPLTTGPFLGREDELHKLVDWLADKTIRLITLVATGGMGKSRLSLELAHQVQEHYYDGAVFIDLTLIRNADDIAQLAIRTLGLQRNGSMSAQDVFFNYCREKSLFLIFDNFEHVLSGARLLSDLLEVAPHITLLVTSRERLNLRVETVFYLQPVIHEAVTLFVEVASMMRPEIAVDEFDPTDVQRIVKLVGGLPLGIILAATWIDTLSVSEIADEIEANLDFLSAEMHDMPERQRSIHAVIDPTWKRLSKQEQQAFMWASVFRGGFTRETFQSVTGASIRTLQSLLNRSLISHGHGRRYDLHPLVRQYAREQLDAHHQLNDAKQAHLQTYVTYVQTHADRMFKGHYLESLDALDKEADNIWAALDWSLDGNAIEQGVALLLSNGEFWLTLSRAQEAIPYVERAIEQHAHPMLYYWQSVYLDRLGQIDRSLHAAEQLVAHAKAKQDDALLAYGQVQLGMMQSTSTQAKPFIESALAYAQKINNPFLVASCHSYLGLVLSGDDAMAHLQHALDLFETLGDLRGLSRVTNNIAVTYYDQTSLNRRAEAKDLLNYSLRLKRTIGDRAGEARRLTTLSLWAIYEEEFEDAQQWLVESRKICEEIGELERLSYTLTSEGLLYLLMTDFPKAQATFERSLQLHDTIKDYKGVVDLYGLLSQLHILQNDLHKAHIALIKGVDVATREYSLPAVLIIAYANYLWHDHQFDACIPIVAPLAEQELKIYSGSENIIKRYLLQPLIYRIQDRIGVDAWQSVVEQYVGVTLEQILQDIAKDILN